MNTKVSGFGLNAILGRLTQCLLFYPLAEAVVDASGMIETNPIKAMITVFVGAVVNVCFICGVVVVVRVGKMLGE